MLLRKLLGETDFKSESGFGTESSPYILSTDFPFLVWTSFSWKKKKVLLVADSADNIFTLWPLEVSQIVAVDIARKACFLNELKYAALKHLSFREFHRLFGPVYQNDLFPSVTPEEKKECYLKVRPSIGRDARKWLDSQVGITDFPSPCWRELMFAHLIPHFSLEKEFNRTKRALRPYPLFNLPMETALERLNEKFDVIYLSNIPEYIKQSLRLEERDEEVYLILEKFYKLALERLRHGGTLMTYIFGNVDSTPDLLSPEIEITKNLGIFLKTVTFSFSTPSIKNSCFTHSLAIIFS